MGRLAVASSFLIALDLRLGLALTCGLVSGEPAALRLFRLARWIFARALVAVRTRSSALLTSAASVSSSDTVPGTRSWCLVHDLPAFTHVVQSPSIRLASQTVLSLSMHSSQIFQHESLMWRYLCVSWKYRMFGLIHRHTSTEYRFDMAA
jgi:hypothetical protein